MARSLLWLRPMQSKIFITHAIATFSFYHPNILSTFFQCKLYFNKNPNAVTRLRKIVIKIISKEKKAGIIRGNVRLLTAQKCLLCCRKCCHTGRRTLQFTPFSPCTALQLIYEEEISNLWHSELTRHAHCLANSSQLVRGWFSLKFWLIHHLCGPQSQTE